MKVAAVNWRLRPVKSFDEFKSHLVEVLDRCVGCDLIVLPELYSLELLGLSPNIDESQIPSFLSPYFLDIMCAGIDYVPNSDDGYLIGGSHIREKNNVSPITSMDACWEQQKIVLTQYERDTWKLKGGARLQVFPPVGVTVCYDCEFPESGRALAEAGVLIQCVPAWTESKQGFNRVRHSCIARSLENQICTVHSSLVGKVGDLESHGSSAIIVPSHEPFPDNPILAETPYDEEGVAIAEVDLGDLIACRELGEVRNWHDRNQSWEVQPIPRTNFDGLFKTNDDV